MRSISYSSAKSNRAQIMVQVITDHAPVAITLKGEGAVVMMSMDDYQGLEETAHLLRSPGNAKRLLDAINEIECGGGGTERELQPRN